MNNKLPSEIHSYLKEISERLWTGHASIMIGAGLSKNAINTVYPLKSPPNWWQLGDMLYEKLYNEKPDNKVKYLSLLKLAEEFEATFGRSSLDNFISRSIADNEYEPSEIHKILMELPWTDVFTTNYDTLLERSCKDVISRRYDVVINQNDLIYSNKPRIIKLHGSLPSERPFIITEEDYRIYPHKFAPFINTVQQSLLENTLCLIGFSGDDPNFLQWIGWINDNLGKDNSPKVYLVGVLNLSESQKKLLINKNIVSVDLSLCDGVNGEHQKGLDYFIKYLNKQRFKRENLNWPLLKDLKTISPSNESVNNKDIIEEWRNCREKYPNWIVLPQEERDRLWIFTESFSYNEFIFNNLKTFEELDYIYELNWRLEKCLFPIYNNLVPHFQKILDKYNFFPKNILGVREIDINYWDDEGQISWMKYKNYWIHLSFALLRFYREERFDNEWINMYKILNSIKEYLSNDEIANFYYEQILNSIFKLKYSEAKQLLDEWPQNNVSVFLNTKRAMLLAEFGFLKEASDLLEINLLDIRRKLNLSPIQEDYNWVSQEALVMFQLKIIQNNISSKNAKDDFNERWNYLLQFKCDPWAEKKYYDIMLQHTLDRQDSISIKKQFEIGQSIKTFSSKGGSKEIVIGYTFLRYMEELAIPLSLQNNGFTTKTIMGALERVKLASPKWVIAILNRYGDEKVVDAIFDREQLVNMSRNLVDDYVKEYISLFKTLLPEINSSSIAGKFLKSVPYILSRLCTKCSEELKLDLFLMYQDVSRRELVLPKLDKFLKSLIDSSNKDTSKKGVEVLLDTPVLDSEWRASYDFKEPFDYFKVKNIESQLKIDDEILDRLFNKSKSDDGIRVNALKRLVFLFRTNSLNENQVKRLFEILWRQTDIDNGLPLNTNFYYFAFIDWPLPNKINAKKLYRKYIKENNFNIQPPQNGISFYGGQDRFAEELLYGSQSENKLKGVVWTINELEVILKKCENWWHSDKKYLLGDENREDGFGGSIYEEFLLRFDNLTEVLSKVFAYRKKELTLEMNERIKILTNEMENYGVSVLKIKIIYELYPNENDYLKELKLCLLQKKRVSIIDALDSIIIVLTSSAYQGKNDFRKQVINLLYTPLEWNILNFVGDVFDVITALLKYYNCSADILEDCVYSSLQYIYDLKNYPTEILLNDYLLLKRQSIKLASAIYKKNITDEIAEIPQIILEWKLISENENEFADIVNRWEA